MLFLRAIFPRWRRPLGGMVVFLIAFFVAAVASDAWQRRPDSARTPNNLIAIAFIAVSLVLLFRPGARGRDLRVLRLGLVSLGLTAIVDNLRGLGVLSWPRSDLEPMGFTVLIACLGTMAVRRAFADAERLFALDRELSIARQIQSAILPRTMPNVAGLAIAAH